MYGLESMSSTISHTKASIPLYIYLLSIYLSIYLYISRKTLRSLRPEVGEFASRAGEDSAGEDMAGQGRGTDQKQTEQKKSRAWGKNRAGHDGPCAI